MEAEILKDELDQAKAELLKSQAQVKELREVLDEIKYEMGTNMGTITAMRQQHIISNIKKAIASTGHEQLQAELDDVSKVLAIISKSGCACPDCRVKVETDLESKRDALLKLI